ncbi:right-handed parallel beta-helix repeat-containing protein [Flavisolibacter sp. BT320]|nr:right-handed parallel beta-helix repeat-containing protein [Flavisolibacter longurius]
MQRYSTTLHNNSRQNITRLLLPGIAVFFLLTGCKKELLPEEQTAATSASSSSQLRGRPEKIVKSGESIQEAVDAAQPNSVIRLLPGTYREGIVVNKPGIEIVGSKGVVIENPGGVNNGITVRSEGDGFVLRHVVIKDFLRNGVFMIRADNYLLSHVTAINDGEYGLYPIFCNNGKIEHCETSGHNDSGIYIGQSTDVEISFNVAHHNVNGIEIENCSRTLTTKNRSYNNVAGILVILLPNLTTKSGSDNIVSDNQINDNNLENFAMPGQFEAAVPSGTGILVVGSDRTIIQNNKIRNNNFVGIATVSTLILGALVGLPPEAFADIEPNPDGTRVVGNLLINNGTAPPPSLPLPAVDLLWDGSGTDNCWKDNQYATSYPSPLPTCN